ncbi:hypothetical protein [Pelagicoccus mobilis]|uniref:PEGA domain-containing protein n=1 Tax=Pelagicoccus mobilis TaxID=415221 RepID=A0A934S1N4_9BACT|nr:hypothetical protein [Pelagicoccus mobilis]MBK1880697.1 hypothetical protein [Pelagicoccus mobilis]
MKPILLALLSLLVFGCSQPEAEQYSVSFFGVDAETKEEIDIKIKPLDPNTGPGFAIDPKNEKLMMTWSTPVKLSIIRDGYKEKIITVDSQTERNLSVEMERLNH